jgi:hypothetical protein
MVSMNRCDPCPMMIYSISHKFSVFTYDLSVKTMSQYIIHIYGKIWVTSLKAVFTQNSIRQISVTSWSQNYEIKFSMNVQRHVSKKNFQKIYALSRKLFLKIIRFRLFMYFFPYYGFLTRVYSVFFGKSLRDILIPIFCNWVQYECPEPY